METRTGKTIRVLVVDDSAVLRELLSDFIEAEPDMTVVAKARDGQAALQQIEQHRPDIVTLDVQMPRMDGLATLDAILDRFPTPVIMVSALTQRDADVTLESLERGALDYVAKPASLKEADGDFRERLVGKLRTMAGSDVRRILRIRAQRKKRVASLTRGGASAGELAEVPDGYRHACVAIGISTGGPPALSQVFSALEPPLPPIVIVQHMPANFTRPFAARLDSLSALTVSEAETGMILKPNHAYVAPGGKHLHVRPRGTEAMLRVADGEPVSGHKPSVDVMMQGAAAVFGRRCLGVIMTGMGHDGVDGCAAIRTAGGYVLGQDQATSDVYGMNKVAFISGHVDRQFALDELPELIATHCRKHFAGTGSAVHV